jgi:hypothetical protein
MAEFKSPTRGLPALDAKYIANVDKLIQQYWARITELRNESAGHILADALEFAVKLLTKEVGKVTWNPDPSGWTVGIECDFKKCWLA